MMSNNIEMMDTNFSNDQVNQSSFITFSDNINENTADTADDGSVTINPHTDKSSNDKLSTSNDAAKEVVAPENTLSKINDDDTEVGVSHINDTPIEHMTSLLGNNDQPNTNANILKSAGKPSEKSDKLPESMEALANHKAVGPELLENVTGSENLKGPPADLDESNLVEKITEDLPGFTKKDLIEEIINTEGLGGTVKNNVTETHMEVENVHGSSSIKIEEITVTETDHLAEKDIKHVEKNHIKEKIGVENQGTVQDDDEGDGILYIDEGNNNAEGNNNSDDIQPKDDQDSDNEDKDKNSSDSDHSVEEEEEDEDEKEFGGNIKEKKRSVMKKATDKSRPAEKIDIEAFKSEWSDEEGDTTDDVDMKDHQKTKAVSNEKTRPTDAVTHDMPEQDASHAEADKTKATLQQGQNENDIVAHLTTDEKKTRKLERTIYDSNGEVIAKGTNAQPNAEPIETSDAHDTLGNAASHSVENSVVNTSGNSDKTTESVDENMDENMLIEEISGDGVGDGMEEAEVVGVVEEVEADKQEVEEEEGDVVMSEGQEEAIVVIGGANGENLEDFVIVNENNEEQEIFEEIAEDGTKTYYLKVKPSAVEQTREMEADNGASTEGGHETAPPEPAANETQEPSDPDSLPIYREKRQGRTKNLVNSAHARKVALQQIEQFQLQKIEKVALMAAKAKEVKPSAGPTGLRSLGVGGRRPTPNVEDVSVKIQLKVDPPDSADKSLLEQKHNLSRDKLERTLQLAQEEKKQIEERKRKELARSLIESLPCDTITAPPGGKPAAKPPAQTVKVTPAKAAPAPPAKATPAKSPAAKSVPAPVVKKSPRATSVPSQGVPPSAGGAADTGASAGGGGDVTPSRKSTRIKIENQTLKDYAVDLPESYSTVYTATSTVTLSRTPGKAGRPSKRKLAEGLELGADSKRFMISYANSRKRGGGLDEDDSANPVIPPLIIENGKEIVDLMLSGDRRSNRRIRATNNEEDLIIVESKKKKPKEFDPSLVPSANELENNKSEPIETSNEDLQPVEEDPTPPNAPVDTSNEQVCTSNDTSLSDASTPTASTKRSPVKTASPRTRDAVKASTTTVVSDQQVLVDVKGMKAKIPANTWNVTSEVDEEEEEEEEVEEEEEMQRTRGGEEKKVKKSGKPSTPLPSKGLKEQEKKRQNKLMREINLLLGDEGAINMLYSVTQKRNRGNESVMDSPVSNKKMKKNLLMKTKLVKSAVLNLTSNSEAGGSESPPTGRLRKSTSALNKSDSPPVANKKGLKKSRARQISMDSVRSSLSSSEHLAKSPSIGQTIAESVIFRRHSSDSSEEEGDNTDGQQVPATPAAVTLPDPRKLKQTIRSNLLKLTRSPSQLTPASSSSPCPALPYVMTSATPAATVQGTKEQGRDTSARAAERGTPSASASTSVIAEVEQELETLFGGGDEKGTEEGERRESVGEAKEKESEETENDLSGVPDSTTPTTTSSTPSAPAQTQVKAKPSSLRKKNKSREAQKQQETPVAESSVRQKSTRKSALRQKQQQEQETEENAETVEQEEQQQQEEETLSQQTSSNADRSAQDEVNVISVKICDDLAYISFLNTTRHNYLTVNLLNELTATLVYLDRQDACKTILMMGTGFASGVDLSYLLCDNRNKRRRNASSMAKALKEFITTLAQLGKPILLGVSGAVVGAAVAILPLFDFVLASNNSTFETLYHKLGQIPECAATFTFPLFLGRNATSELLMSCKKMTSQEAKSLNLITRVCSHDAFEKSAEMWAKEISKYSAQSMQTTKLLLRKDMYSQLNETLSTETDFLIEHWTSEEVQKNLKKHLMSV